MTFAVWRTLVTAPLAGAENMALDEVLLERAAHTGESVFRVYGWSAPTLSFGRNQHAQRVYDPALLAAHGIAVVRRPTGGRALLHHREVTYSVTAPIAGRSLRGAYFDINRSLCEGLARLGIHATVAEGGRRATPPGPLPCFDAPAAGELTVEGRKLVGSAQWRTERALLQHGSILLFDDQSLLPTLASVPLPAVPAPATLTELLGRTPDLAEVASALFSALGATAGPCVPLLESEVPREGMAEVANQYRDESWTWRR